MQTDSKHLAWIACGSNIDPQIYLPRAIQSLAELGTVCRKSSIWQSAPVGDVHQADFCNGAVQLRTPLGHRELREKLRKIETQLGRVRDPKNKNAARTIDLDIALFDDLIYHDDQVEIPDPQISERPFLAVPLAELDPDFSHPQTGQPLRAIAEGTGGTATLQRRDDIHW